MFAGSLHLRRVIIGLTGNYRLSSCHRDILRRLLRREKTVARLQRGLGMRYFSAETIAACRELEEAGLLVNDRPDDDQRWQNPIVDDLLLSITNRAAVDELLAGRQPRSESALVVAITTKPRSRLSPLVARLSLA
jgi:hypothetical protein